MKTCTICRFHYADTRTHCPVCGTFHFGELGAFTLHGEVMQRIERARNAQHIRPAYAGKGPRMILVDGD